MTARYASDVARAICRRVSSRPMWEMATWSAACVACAQRDAASTGKATCAPKAACVCGWVTCPWKPRSVVQDGRRRGAVDRRQEDTARALQHRFGTQDRLRRPRRVRAALGGDADRFVEVDRLPHRRRRRDRRHLGGRRLGRGLDLRRRRSLDRRLRRPRRHEHDDDGGAQRRGHLAATHARPPLPAPRRRCRDRGRDQAQSSG